MGRFTVTEIEADGNVLVSDGVRNGRVRPDQCYPTKKAAMAPKTHAGSGWAAAAILGTMVK